MALIDDLLLKPRLSARCPICEETFSLRKARLFDATKALPAYAHSYIARTKQEIGAQQEDLRRRRALAREAPRRSAEAVRVGQVVEKISPSLPGFPLEARDCRALFQPIDYVAFKGLSNNGTVDAVVFIDVKSGGAALQTNQRQIQAVVNQGKLSLLIM